jgi:hypothetical protein
VYVKYNSSGVFAQLLSVRFQFINANFWCSPCKHSWHSFIWVNGVRKGTDNPKTQWKQKQSKHGIKWI